MKKILLIFTICGSTALVLNSCNDNSEDRIVSADSAGAAIQTTVPDNAMAPADDNARKSPDAQLVYELTESMYAGIALMKDGQKKATTPEVKALADKLVTEHTALTKELEGLSNKKGWALPAGEPAADMQTREAMNKEETKQFEKDWLAALRERHETNAGKLESAKPADADVKAAGEKGLPKIKMLLADIKSVQTKVK